MGYGWLIQNTENWEIFNIQNGVLQLRNVQTKRHPSYRKSLQLPRAFVVLEAPCKPENISQLKIIEELFTPAVQMIDSVRTDQLIKEKVYTKWRTEQVHFCLAYEKA